MAWWLWALLGIALLILEVHTFGGFYLLFFGVGALLVASLSALGLELPWLQWVLFTVLSVVSLLLFRPPIVRRLKASEPTDPVDTLVGEEAIPDEDIATTGVGKAELRGTGWTVRNAGTALIPKGTRCRVQRVEGLTLWIRPE
jgi:membrane protein implicated in regulation of membrane protease activity